MSGKEVLSLSAGTSSKSGCLQSRDSEPGLQVLGNTMLLPLPERQNQNSFKEAVDSCMVAPCRLYVLEQHREKKVVYLLRMEVIKIV